MNPKSIHPLIAMIHGAFIQARVEKQAAQAKALSSLNNVGWVTQHTNEKARLRRESKRMIGARQLKKMQKASRRALKEADTY